MIARRLMKGVKGVGAACEHEAVVGNAAQAIPPAHLPADYVMPRARRSILFAAQSAAAKAAPSIPSSVRLNFPYDR
jgi:hypothetical protein